tara:strand:- start:495 stop:794 length:300 start_codon:yes stop_codon:yes gene_type:complete
MESNLANIIENIDIEMVEKIARRLKPWTENQKRLRLNFLYKQFTSEQIKEIKQEALEISYDKSFFENTHLNYLEPDTLLIKCALSEYLLKNAKKEKIPA